MRITFIGLCTAMLLLSGCQTEKKDSRGQYVLNAEVSGIKNGAWAYLLLDNNKIDSAQVIDSRFSFQGKVDHPTEFDLYIANTRNHTGIWLEEGQISFKAEDGKFKEAQITGSASQKDSDRFWKPIWAYRAKRDSLNRIVNSDTTSESQKILAKKELKTVWVNHLSLEKAFIKNNPNAYISASTLDFYATSFDKATVERLFNNFGDHLKGSRYGQSIQRYLELQNNLKVGDTYVDFSMNNKDDEVVNLSDYEGNLILLDFWASWCMPCIKEMPTLKEVYKNYHDQGFEIIGISEDESKAVWENAIAKFELDWVNLWDDVGNEADSYLIYNISGIPDNFLINSEGTIIARGLRGEDLKQAVKEEMEKKMISK